MAKLPRKTTIVKVVDSDYKINADDIERWREIFEKKLLTPEQAVATGEVEIEYLEDFSEENSITLVKVGDENYKPNFADLEAWRKIFEDAKNDPNFVIFTHHAVNISILPIGKITDIEQASKKEIEFAVNDDIINQLK